MNMSDAELAVFHRYLHNATSYLEFGSGISTCYAATLVNLTSIVSVESSASFVQESVLPNHLVQQRYQRGDLQFHIVNIGETKQWGFPVNTRYKHLWANYSLSVFNNRDDFDLVLVDGRFRVACTMATLLSTGGDTIVAIHDFWHRPEEYHVVLPFLDELERVESLGIFRRKNEIDLFEAQRVLEEHLFTPA